MHTILPDKPLPDVGEAVALATRYFEQHALGFGQGTTAAIDDAVWLVLECAGQSPLEAPDYSQRLTAAQVRQCNDFLRQRVEQQLPAAYIAGRTWFAGYEFRSDPRALVPRSPIAELILADFHALVELRSGSRVLDLCTGGGCIALAIALHNPDVAVVGTDISTEALALAVENRSMHALDNRVELVAGNLFEPVTGRFDLIVSNPPYVDASDMAQLTREFTHEPRLGLAAGEDGLDLVPTIISEAANYLQPGGWLIVEVGNSAQALVDAYPDVEFLWFDFRYGGDGVFGLPFDELVRVTNQYST